MGVQADGRRQTADGGRVLTVKIEKLKIEK